MNLASPTVSQPSLRAPRLAVGALAVATPACALAADAVGRGLSFGTWVLLLPVAIAFGLGLHSCAARTLKAFLSKLRPLAVSEPAIAGYERGVYDSTQPAMLLVATVAIGGGAMLWYAAYTAQTLAWLGCVGLLLLAVLLDIALWQRVEVSADYVWFRRGFAGSVHQVVIDNIRDVTIEREPAGLTLRRGVRSVSVRLKMRMKDRYVAALPKAGHADDVAAVARQIDHRLATIRVEKAARPVDPDRKLRRALRKLQREQAQPASAPAPGPAPQAT
jgi:hypothetical protein